MTKAEFIHALHDFPLSTEIKIGVGDPLILVSVDSWFPLENNGYVLIGNFLPKKEELTFLCRICRGSITKNTAKECPVCKGEGRVTIENYHRW